MKTCCRCGESLPRDSFGRRAASADGLQPYCRPCQRAYTADRRQAYRAAGLPADSDRHGTLTGYTNWGCRCGPCTAAGVANTRAWQQAARARGLPEDSDRHGTWVGYNGCGCRCEPCMSAGSAYIRAWREAHPDAARANKRRRRALLAGVESTPYRDVDIIARDREAGGCRLCGLPLPDDRRDIHLDHRIPLVRGGADTPENVFAVHATCNLTKGTLSEDEARAKILAAV